MTNEEELALRDEVEYLKEIICDLGRTIRLLTGEEE